MIDITPVILCGGTGTRLWPLSRTDFPKQFLSVLGQGSLFQQTIKRLKAISKAELCLHSMIVVAHEDHKSIVMEQVKEEIGLQFDLLLEQECKNTAPALTFAALQALCEGADPILIVSPADHLIVDIVEFERSILRAVCAANLGAIVVLGAKADRPETGYGYIKHKAIKGQDYLSSVEEFIEKPSLEVAKKFLSSAEFSWNSGIFVLRASVWIEAIREFNEEIYAACTQAWDARSVSENIVRPFVQKSFEGKSIDYAVMEKCPKSHFDVKMIPFNVGWSDLGTWESVWLSSVKDVAGNVTQGEVISCDSSNSLVLAQSRLVCAVGVKNLVVIEMPDAVLVADISSSQSIKSLTTELKKQERSELDLSIKVHRPWGWYKDIDCGVGFKVKRIFVEPGESLSLQQHFHRNEHWTVVKGTARVECDEVDEIVQENKSVYIPLGSIHRLSNPGHTALEVIEVQTGNFLSEHDIIRYEDKYGRH